MSLRSTHTSHASGVSGSRRDASKSGRGTPATSVSDTCHSQEDCARYGSIRMPRDGALDAPSHGRSEKVRRGARFETQRAQARFECRGSVAARSAQPGFELDSRPDIARATVRFACRAMGRWMRRRTAVLRRCGAARGSKHKARKPGLSAGGSSGCSAQLGSSWTVVQGLRALRFDSRAARWGAGCAVALGFRKGAAARTVRNTRRAIQV